MHHCPWLQKTIGSLARQPGDSNWNGSRTFQIYQGKCGCLCVGETSSVTHQPFFLKPLDVTSKYHGNTMGTWIIKVVTPFYYKSCSLIRKFHACWYRAPSGAVSFWVWYRVRRLSPAAAGITTKIWVICHQPSTRLTVKKRSEIR